MIPTAAIPAKRPESCIAALPVPASSGLAAFECTPMARRQSANQHRREAIECAVARALAVPIDALQTTTRGRAHVARARQIAMYLAHVVCGLSLTEVGRVFRRDRTTVSHACALIEDGRDDPLFDRLLELMERIAREEIRRRLGSADAVIAWRSVRREPAA